MQSIASLNQLEIPEAFGFFRRFILMSHVTKNPVAAYVLEQTWGMPCKVIPKNAWPNLTWKITIKSF